MKEKKNTQEANIDAQIRSMEVQIASMEAMWNKDSADKKVAVDQRKVTKLVQQHVNNL
jgi:hypothetical protein